ncbi:MAG: 4a-hydroxytetrahydrobiopterin dehydratase [Gallionellales bacterium RBG_16_57_15]|nr:MAG: 4a-hydroxytetrahydrobiopterin dehydratase [Gallionellales bacterium RBG_16_57_15]
MTNMNNLDHKRCKPCETGMPPLAQPVIDSLLQQLEGWQQYDRLISKTYHFKDYYQTIAFVNAIAWMSHREDHHPELTVTYSSCHVEYSTHAIHGLSENDFICAAKVNALLKN